MPAWAAPGYVQGKRMAEACAAEFVASGRAGGAGEVTQGAARGALVLKPGAIYGTRHSAGGLPIPLAPVLAPVSWGLHAARGAVEAATHAAPGLLGGALVPPVSVEDLAALAANGALSDEYAGTFTVVDAWMQEHRTNAE